MRSSAPAWGKVTVIDANSIANLSVRCQPVLGYMRPTLWAVWIINRTARHWDTSQNFVANSHRILYSLGSRYGMKIFALMQSFDFDWSIRVNEFNLRPLDPHAAHFPRSSLYFQYQCVCSPEKSGFDELSQQRLAMRGSGLSLKTEPNATQDDWHDCQGIPRFPLDKSIALINQR